MRIRALVIVVAVMAALPTSNAGAARPVRATVLAADQGAHTVRVVLDSRAVRTYRYSGRLQERVRLGARVSILVVGERIRVVRVRSISRSISFYARYTGGADGAATLRLGDGRPLRVRAHGRAGAAGAGPSPGDTVLVALRVGRRGQAHASLAVVEAAAGSATGNPSERGRLTWVAEEAGEFGVRTVAGEDLILRASAGLLRTAGAQECDLVAVAYAEVDGALVADELAVTGRATSGSCAEPQDDVIDGKVVDVDRSARGFTLELSNGDELSFSADRLLLDELTAGGLVEVAYYESSRGELIAEDVQAIDPDGDLDGAGEDGYGDGG